MPSSETPYTRLTTLGLTLPPPPRPIANFASFVTHGGLVYLSGQGPTHAGGAHRGKVGADVSLEQAYDHARVTGLNLLAILEEAAGGLGRVQKILKIFGMVNAGPDFIAHPMVINGCSDLMIGVFGPEIGRHARSAVGMRSLPGGITVEIELIAALQD